MSVVAKSFYGKTTGMVSSVGRRESNFSGLPYRLAGKNRQLRMSEQNSFTRPWHRVRPDLLAFGRVPGENNGKTMRAVWASE